MSTTVDNRVVQMTFNNKQFEKGVDETLKTIDKLNKALKFEDASDGFENLQDAANSVDFKQLSDNVQSISDRFSGLGIIGAQIWSGIGNAAIDLVTGPFKKVEQAFSNITSKVENQIVQGGWNRALNLEKAEFMLKNLGQGWDTAKDAEGRYVEYTVNKDGKEVKNAYRAIAEAVDGTAFSLDEAASAAANFLASGVDAGEDLYNVLRSVQGMSSIFSTDFNQVAGYYQKMASAGAVTQGVVTYMTQTMDAPIAELLKEGLGITDEELNEALKDGLISFETFSDVMLQKFGDSLDEANNSYEGVMNNIRSAFSRIGAEVEEPLIKRMIPTLNLLRLTINNVKKTLVDSGFYNFINSAIERLFTLFDKILTPLSDAEKEITWLKNIATGLTNIFEGFSHILNSFGVAYRNVFGSKSQKDTKTLSQRFLEFSERFKQFFDASPNGKMKKVVTVFKAFLNVIKAVKSVLSPVITIFKNLLGIILKIVGSVVYLTSLIVNGIAKLVELIKHSKTYVSIVNLLKIGFDKLSTGVKDILTNIKNLADKFKDLISQNPVVKAAVDTLKDAFSFLDDKVSTAIDSFATFIENSDLISTAKNVLTDAFNTIKDAIGKAIDKFEEFTGIDVHIPTFEEVKEAFINLKNFIGEIASQIKEKIIDLVGKFEDFTGIDLHIPSLDELADAFESFYTNTKKHLTDFADTAFWAFKHPREAIEGLWDKIKQFKDYLENKFSNAGKSFEEATNHIGTYFVAIENNAEKAKGAIKEFFNDTSEDEQIQKKTTIFQSLADALGSLKSALTNFGSAIANVGKTILGAIINAYSSIKGIVKDMTWVDFLNNLKMLIDLFAGYEWGRVGKGLADFLLNVSSASKVAKTGIVTLTQYLPKLLLSVGAAFTMFAFSLNIISNIPEKNLANAETALTAVIGIAIILLAVLKKLKIIGKEKTAEEEDKDKEAIPDKLMNFIKKKFGNVADYLALGTFITSLGLALIELAGAFTLFVKGIKGAKFSEIITAVGVLIVFIVVLLKMVKKLMETMSEVKTKDLQKTFGTFDIIALGFLISSVSKAVLVLAFALSGIASLPVASLVKGGTVIVVIMAAILGMIVAILKISEKIQKNSEGLNKGPSFAAMAAFVVAITAAILLMVPAILILGLVADKTDGIITKGIIALVFIAAIMGVTAALVGSVENTKGSAALVLATAASLLLCAMACKKIGDISLGGIISSLLVMVAMGALMFIAAKAFQDEEAQKSAKTGAMLMAVVAASLLAAAFALKELGSLNVKELVTAASALLLIIGLIVVLEIAAAVISGSAGTQTALVAIGAAFLGIGAGIFLFAAGLKILIPLMEEMQEKSEEFKGKIQTFTDMLVEIILSFFTSLIAGFKRKAADMVPELGGLILALIISIVTFLNDNAFAIGEAIGLLMAALAKAFVAAIVSFFSDIWATIRGKDGFNEGSPSKTLKKIGKLAIEGLLIGLKSIIEDVWEFIKSIPGKIIDLIFPDDMAENIKEIGSNIIGFFTDGIKSAAEGVASVVSGIASTVTGAFDAASDAVEEGLESLLGEAGAAHEEAMRLREEAANARNVDAQKAYDESGADEFLKEYRRYEEMYNKYVQGLEEVKRASNNNVDFIDAYKRTHSSELKTITEGMTYYAKQYEDATDKASAIADGWITTYEDKSFNGSFRAGDSIAKNLLEGYKNGILNYMDITDRTTRNWAKNNISAAEEEYEVESPSKVFARIGKYVVLGFSKGVEDNAGYGVEAIEQFGDEVTAVLNSDAQPVITPVLDFASVQNGANQIGYIYSEGVKAAADLDIKSDAGRTAETLDNMSDLFNQIIFNTDSTGVEGKLDITASLLTQLLTALSTQQLVLDTGAVVGGIAPAMDKELGMRSIRAGRRV